LQEIEVNKRFAACCWEDEQGGVEVDFDAFHELVPDSQDPNRPPVQG